LWQYLRSVWKKQNQIQIIGIGLAVNSILLACNSFGEQSHHRTKIEFQVLIQLYHQAWINSSMSFDILSKENYLQECMSEIHAKMVFDLS